ncbi:L-lactate dehydrogenase 1 [Striga asiatica]|uniref:L-lactate dehydrogenase 1 n=1 Tax=Striga asiatica TaxID=4170 RepID=A0A5A7NZS4_STRAF|nr:L-lactate dehydrogenase 1 [Striga asiatica]
MAQTNQLPPLVGSPPVVVMEAESGGRSSTPHSIETLVVVLAVITILGVVAGIIARLCGGRHLGSHGDHDVEGWVERRCRSCIDGGVATEPPKAAAAAEEAKK